MVCYYVRELKERKVIGYLIINVESCIIEQTGTSVDDCFLNLKNSWKKCFNLLFKNECVFNFLEKRIPECIIRKQQEELKPFLHMRLTNNINYDSCYRLCDITINNHSYYNSFENEQVEIYYSLKGFINSYYAQEYKSTQCDGRRIYDKTSKIQYYGYHKSDNLRLKIIIVKGYQFKQLNNQLKPNNNYNTLEKTKTYLDKKWSTLPWHCI